MKIGFEYSELTHYMIFSLISHSLYGNQLVIQPVLSIYYYYYLQSYIWVKLNQHKHTSTKSTVKYYEVLRRTQNIIENMGTVSVSR